MKRWRRIGRRMVIKAVIMMVETWGPSPLVSQLSSSYHAMILSGSEVENRVWNIFQKHRSQ
jgi:hypothetical protein